jgi:cold shock CspA family protein
MRVALETSYRDVKKTEALENLIAEKTEKLERICDHMMSCRVALERTQKQASGGDLYRIRLDLTVPPGHEVVVKKEGREDAPGDPAAALVRQAYDVAFRELKELVGRQRREVKSHPEQEVSGVVAKLFSEGRYGFITALDGRELYFHENSVVGQSFDELQVGDGVRFAEEQGDEGPQASTVQVVQSVGGA